MTLRKEQEHSDTLTEFIMNQPARRFQLHYQDME
jgi:hypothetical protein